MGESLILGLLAGRSATQSHSDLREGENGKQGRQARWGGGDLTNEDREGGEREGGAREEEGTKCSLPPVD